MPHETRPRLTLDQLATRRLARLVRRRHRSMPLFVATGIADQVQPLPSLQEIKAWYTHLHISTRLAHLKRLHRSLGVAHHYYTLVAALASPTQMRRLVQRRRIYPPTPEYAADYWRKVHQNLKALP